MLKIVHMVFYQGLEKPGVKLKNLAGRFYQKTKNLPLNLIFNRLFNVFYIGIGVSGQ